MKKYVFGVISSKYELEANDDITAYITMCLFFKENIPIAVYEPKESCIMPLTILKKYKDKYSKVKVRNCYETIKEVELK